MSKINYAEYFHKPIEKEKYVVQLKLVNPKEIFNLKEIHEKYGINIKKTFMDSVDRFNSHKSRNNDGANISDVEIDQDCIYFMLSINKGKLFKMRSLIGNTISKWLYNEESWNSLINESSNKNKLFSLDYKELIE